MRYSKEAMLDREYFYWREAFETLTLKQWVEDYSRHTDSPDFVALEALNSASWILMCEARRRANSRDKTQAEIRAAYAK